jgi:hypothetical protein
MFACKNTLPKPKGSLLKEPPAKIFFLCSTGYQTAAWGCTFEIKYLHEFGTQFEKIQGMTDGSK